MSACWFLIDTARQKVINFPERVRDSNVAFSYINHPNFELFVPASFFPWSSGQVWTISAIMYQMASVVSSCQDVSRTDTCSSFILASLWFCLLTRCLCLLQVRPASLVEWRWQLGRLNMMELTRNWQYLSSKSILLYSYSNYGYLYVSITIAVAVAVRESRELGFAFPDFFRLYILTSLRNSWFGTSSFHVPGVTEYLV